MRLKLIGATAVAGMLLLGAGCGGDEPNQTDNEMGTSQTVEPTPEPEPEVEEEVDVEPVAEAEPEAEDEKPKPEAKPKDKRESGVGRTWLVARIVDGDTLELGDGAVVRLVGIDTPEAGECGYERAGEHLAELVLGERVALHISDEDRDHWGRLLRYVDVRMNGRVVDAGLNQIRSGLAIARYDSRDGYGFHPREPEYIRSDRGTPQFKCAPEPEPTTGGGCHPNYTPCLPVVYDLDCGEITGPVAVHGSDPYRLDANGDGVGCE